MQSPQNLSQTLTNEVHFKFAIGNQISELFHIHSQSFKNEAYMLPTRSGNFKRVQESPNIEPPTMFRTQTIDMLIHWQLTLRFGRTIGVHFQSDVCVVLLEIMAEPDSRSISVAKFSDDGVAVLKDLANLHGVVVFCSVAVEGFFFDES